MVCWAPADLMPVFGMIPLDKAASGVIACECRVCEVSKCVMSVPKNTIPFFTCP